MMARMGGEAGSSAEEVVEWVATRSEEDGDTATAAKCGSNGNGFALRSEEDGEVATAAIYKHQVVLEYFSNPLAAEDTLSPNHQFCCNLHQVLPRTNLVCSQKDLCVFRVSQPVCP